MGLILRAVEDTALANVTKWISVAKFDDEVSTWRGVPPQGYVVAGDFLVNGSDEPTQDQTAGIKAIREDLVALMKPQRLIWKGSDPSGDLSLWDIVAVPLIYVPFGVYRSNDGVEAPDALVDVLLFFS
jgi:hypothetical protein